MKIFLVKFQRVVEAPQIRKRVGKARNTEEALKYHAKATKLYRLQIKNMKAARKLRRRVGKNRYKTTINQKVSREIETKSGNLN